MSSATTLRVPTSTQPSVCTIKVLPKSLWIPSAQQAIKINPANAPATQMLQRALPGAVIPVEHLALLTAKYWGIKGVRLTVGFLDNPPADLRTRLLSHMNAWSRWANVQFVETSTNPQVRISRTPGDGYWSYLGVDILSIPQNQPTMNLDSFSMQTAESEYHRVVRHETGHTLGFPHEHTRDQIVARIDRNKAIAYFEQTQGWSEQEVIAQVLTPLDNSALIETAQADPNSIMCYWLPASIMKDNVAVAGGTDIDRTDATFAASVYPKRTAPFSHRILETGTTFAPTTDGVWLMADYDRDGIPDLVFIKTRNTGTGKVEVHIASGKSNYQTRILETGTTFAPEADGTWLMADYDRDGIPDLVFIKTSNTGTGRVEVHIASGKSNYQTRILDTGTAFALETGGTWLMADYDRDGIPDLVFIKTSNTGTGRAEVHVASGKSNYQSRVFESGTTFSPETDGTWMMANYDHDGIPDLIFLKTSNTGTNSVEVHVASGSSHYQTRVLETGTTFAPETDGTWTMADYNHDGNLDLVLIKTSNTGTGKVEVHVAAGG